MYFLAQTEEIAQAIEAVAPLQLNVVDILLRFLCAMAVGLVIGTEREYTHRPAGMRTHILVALGACAVMITGQMIFVEYRPYGSTADPARLAAQVITGVGFLGAGTIIREGASVKGLTTAASLWAVACLGVAAGGGYYAIALAGMVFLFVTLTLFELIQRLLIKTPGTSTQYSVETDDTVNALRIINALAGSCRAEVQNLTAENLPEGHFLIAFRIEYGNGRKKKRQQKFLEGLAASEHIRKVQTQQAAEAINV